MQYGKFRALVSKINDTEENMGRIKVKCPTIYGVNESPWCTPCMPCVGDGIGIFMFPSIGDSVWIEFEEGDVDYPIWVGGFWQSRKTPFATDYSTEKIVITTATGAKIVINSLKNTIEVTGDTTITGDLNVTGDITSSKTIIDTTGNTNNHTHP